MTCTLYLYTYDFQKPVFPSLPITLYQHTRASWIQRNKVASNNSGRGVSFDGGTSQYKHAPTWCRTVPCRTVQEHAVSHCRVCGMRLVSLPIARVKTRGVIHAVSCDTRCKQFELKCACVHLLPYSRMRKRRGRITE